MCILSLYREKERFIFTHNRDENFLRISSENLILKQIEDVEVIYPEDILSGGTWILTTDLWTTALLNGAEKKHKRKNEYKHSRGLFPFILSKYRDVITYVESLDLEGVEPFTQIILNNKTIEAWKLQWDERDKKLTKIEDLLYVVSSSTLYSPEEKESHQKKIKSLKEYNTDTLSQIHQKLSWTQKVEFPQIKTTSIVQIDLNKKEKHMKYLKLN